MADQQARRDTDARFRAVLREIAQRTLDQSGEGRNGDVFVSAYKPLPAGAPWDAIPERLNEDEWLDDILGLFLRDPEDPLRAMLAARERLRENLLLIEDINLDRLRDQVRRHEVLVAADDIDTLLDFVAEIRKIAKEI